MCYINLYGRMSRISNIGSKLGHASAMYGLSRTDERLAPLMTLGTVSAMTSLQSLAKVAQVLFGAKTHNYSSPQHKSRSARSVTIEPNLFQ